jgi:hypothetical protein
MPKIQPQNLTSDRVFFVTPQMRQEYIRIRAHTQEKNISVAFYGVCVKTFTENETDPTDPPKNQTFNFALF